MKKLVNYIKKLLLKRKLRRRLAATTKDLIDPGLTYLGVSPGGRHAEYWCNRTQSKIRKPLG